MRRFLIMLPFLLAACGDFGSYGHDFDLVLVSQLQTGVSTEADAKKLFGEPTNTEKAKDSDDTLYEWTYGYYSMGASRIKHLAITFGRDGRMHKVVAESNN